MAYQDLSHPAQVLSREITATRRFAEGIGAFFARLGQALVTNPAGQRRLDMVQALQSKSDAELAALRIKREKIVQHVFRDLYYI
ncbi:MAG: hypothetical protein HKN30_09690 [Sulfitobacter sp.]|nr:hypothetical protein [Sulfitobacter sp.]